MLQKRKVKKIKYDNMSSSHKQLIILLTKEVAFSYFFFFSEGHELICARRILFYDCLDSLGKNMIQGSLCFFLRKLPNILQDYISPKCFYIQASLSAIGQEVS